MKTLMFLSLLAFGKSAKLPSDFRKCQLKDPNLNKCLLEAIKTGLPQLTKPYEEVNLPNLDPLLIPKVAINGPVNFTHPFENGKLYGLITAKIKKFEFDFGKKTIELEAIFPKIQVTGQQNLNSKILALPFIGAGIGTTTLKNLKVEATFLFDETKTDGKTYIKIVSGSLDMQPSFVDFGFDNLESGSAFTDHINQILKANWRGIYDDAEGDYTENFLKVFTALLNNFFSKVSLEDAFD